MANKPFSQVLQEAVKTLDVVNYRLQNHKKRLEEIDKRLFNEVVNSLKKQQKDRAKVVANELSVVRKAIKMVMTLEIALETIKQRLISARDFGEIAALLSPAIRLTKELSPSLARLMPEANLEVERTLSELSNLLVETTGAGIEGPEIIMTPEAEQIINEAGALAELKAKKILPEVPISASPLEAAEA